MNARFFHHSARWRRPGISLLMPLLALGLLAPGWVNPAQADSRFRKTTSVRYYAISGHDERDLLRHMRRVGPRVGGKPALARTRMQAKYHASLQQKGASCRVSNFQARVHYTITLPRLRNPKALKTASRKRWRHFHKRLRAHENRHIAIWNRCLHQARRELLKLRARNCHALKRKMRARYRSIMQACNRKHDAFDAHEQHVATNLPFIRAAFALPDGKKARGKKTRARKGRARRVASRRGRK